jgi:hypothetical protein
MASVIVAGNTSGSVSLFAPDVSGSTVLTLPTTTGTLVVNSGAQTIEFADGSASAPSITNSGDTNTGMFFPAADTIAFAEGGTESMRIDSAGNLGVGLTPSPWTSNRRALQIGGNTSSAISLSTGVGEFLYNSYLNSSSQLVATTTGNIGYHDFNNNVANTFTWGISAASVTAGSVGSVPVGMRLDNSGNFTIAGALSFASFLGGLGKVGTFNRNTGTASGTVAYTGVGFRPSTIIFFAGIDNVTALSFGFTDATNGRCLISDSVSSVGVGAQSFAQAIRYSRTIAGNGTTQAAVISSMDADGFTLSWTKTDIGTGGTANNIVVNYLAFR